MSSTNHPFQRAGAVSHDNGKTWTCRGCGLPVESGDAAADQHGVPIAFYAIGQDKGTPTLHCQRRIGKIVDMVAQSARRQHWLIEKAAESFALPEYLRSELVKSVAVTAKPPIRTVTMWYLEVRQTMRHAIETCQKRPPLSKRAEQAAKLTLSRSRWA